MAQSEPVTAVFEIGNFLIDPLFLTFMSGYLKLVTCILFFLFEQGSHILFRHMAVAGINQAKIILTRKFILIVSCNMAKLDICIYEFAVAGNIYARGGIPEQGGAEICRRFR